MNYTVFMVIAMSVLLCIGLILWLCMVYYQRESPPITLIENPLIENPPDLDIINPNRVKEIDSNLIEIII